MRRQRAFRVLSPRGSRGSFRHQRRITARRPKHQKRAVKRATMRDCSRRCVYCATPLTPEQATLDHVLPVSRGGTHAPGNLVIACFGCNHVIACFGCNQLKGDALPLDFFARHPWAGANFTRYARAVHRALKRGARRVVSLALAA